MDELKAIVGQLDEELASLRRQARKPKPAITDHQPDIKTAQGASVAKGGGVPAGAPFVTTGPLGEQPFSLSRAILGAMMPDEYGPAAKNELDVLKRFRQAIIETHSNPSGSSISAYWLPISWDYLPQQVKAHKHFQYVQKAMANATLVDADQVAHARKKAQSAFNDALGGSLVAPPTMGPVIPLIRPTAALLEAGAQTFPLPAQGRHVRPRITGAPVVQSVSESQDAPESDLGTSQMELSAKKIAGLARISEEAMAFTTGAIDLYVRQELERSLGLKLDAFGFYGLGGPAMPAGLTSPAYDGAIVQMEVDYPTAKGIDANGNALLPQYGDLLPALIGERSFILEQARAAWVMRPAAFASAIGLRADAVAVSDRAGPFVDILRQFGDEAPTQWRGRRVVITTNIRGDRTKGTGTKLSDVFFGLWNHCIVASYGAIQFRQGDDANTVRRGEFLVRAVMYGDIGYEYPQAFLWYPNVKGDLGL